MTLLTNIFDNYPLFDLIFHHIGLCNSEIRCRFSNSERLSEEKKLALKNLVDTVLSAVLMCYAFPNPCDDSRHFIYAV